MKKLKLQGLKIYSSLLLVILAILGCVSSCEKPQVEYGVPSAKFIAKGNIQSSDSLKAIEGIQIVFGQWDTVYSDQNGNYNTWLNSFPDKQDLLIQFKDVDGSVNGEFLNKDTLVEFDNPDFKDDIWTGPDTEREVNIKLGRK